MKYYIDYQYMPKESARPLDNGEAVAIETDGAAVIPNVGDYIHIDNSSDPDGRVSFSGKVKSRLFRYIRVGNEMTCGVNIVVAEDDDDWGLLIKE